MIQEFKEFINKGNFIDIAVGFVMGAAFTAVVTTFVDRLVNPLISLVFDVGDLESVGTFAENGSVGAVIAALINFALIGLVLFFVVRAYNHMRRPIEAAGPSEEVTLLTEIRDALTTR
jgi:large conductance mechanosensitive channel